jgi:hypothetical protein
VSPRECGALHCHLPINGVRPLRTPIVTMRRPWLDNSLLHLTVACILKTKRQTTHVVHGFNNLIPKSVSSCNIWVMIPCSLILGNAPIMVESHKGKVVFVLN